MLNGFPLGSAYLADQLKRAVSSVLLNQAEGNGRRTPKERRRFFDIDQATYLEVKDKLEQVVRILYKLH